MSIKAMNLVLERSRAKGNHRFILYLIADYARDNGRDAFPSTPLLAAKTLLTPRGVRKILHGLAADGELEIEQNAAGRMVDDERGGRWCPPSFLHIRCVSDWERYSQNDDPKGEQGSPFMLRTGRPKRERRSSLPRRKRGTPVPRNGNTGAPKGEQPGSACTDVRTVRTPADPLGDPLEILARADEERPKGFAFKGTRVQVPHFLSDEFNACLGTRSEDFDLLAWYPIVDQRLTNSNDVVLDLIGWLRAEFRKELVRRGFAKGALSMRGDRKTTSAARVPQAHLERERRQHEAQRLWDEQGCTHVPACATYYACISRLMEELKNGVRQAS